ncbi:MAG: type II toxin-antitoxin system ParD family antitoxin [Hormoscilla sp. GUM202]|nr:type II toxin-antitoxin system ParD family antitoxin [Hormoscilla sp. GUM202]
MTTLNISLTEELRAFIDEQVAQGSYNNASEYVQNLIIKAQLETMLLEGLDSGEPIDVTDEWWELKRSRLTGMITKLQPQLLE